MLRWYLMLLMLPTTIYAIGHPRYECGDHGRFEYCIDGVPGCIVGCHCHPGYYFDTQSKICEANSKLVQEYRRMFLAEPTRVEIPMTPPDYMDETMPTPTTTNPINNQVDNIAKDTDDLGDWLYNQFFKTIEGEAVNGTVKDKPTRRSDMSSLFKKPRRFHKKSKSSSNKIKIKNNDLRRKLLRITEDDSLFDSHSESEETSASSSSNSKSDTTAEENNDTHPNDKEHGHRKILVINKKPKPPLPSFIFLPNIETPFYPPIGLPPPPAIPMFPMIPVPPMPVFPYPPGTTECSQTTTRKPEIEDKQIETDKEREERDKKEREEHERKEGEEEEKKDKNDKNSARSGREMMTRTQNTKRGQRKILRHSPQILPSFLRDERKKNKRLLGRNFLHRNPDTPLFDELSPQDVPIHDEMLMKPLEDSQVPAPREDVGFKYLSQLIHKVDPNITHEDLNKNTFELNNAAQPLRRTFETRYYNYDTPPEQHQPEQYQSHLIPQPQEFQSVQRQPTKTIGERRFTTMRNEPDDSYYANLGQQIAALIRKVDSVGDRQIDAGLEQTQNSSPYPVFNGNSYSSRSYWERSVRSPLQQFQPSTGDFNYIQRNYESLLNLEKKVEIFATTEHPLSLQEIENIVFLMDKAKSQLQDNIKNIETFKTATQNLNINLLPRQSEILTTKQSNKVIVTNTNSDDDSVSPQQSELSKRISKVNEEYNIERLPKHTKYSKTKRRNNDNFKNPMVLIKPNPTKNTSNTADDLRGILMHNFKNVAPNIDLGNDTPNTGLRKVVPYSDLTYFEPNTILRNLVSNTDLKKFGPDFLNDAPNTNFKHATHNTNPNNNELYTNYRNSLPNSDFSNIHNNDFRIEVPDSGSKNLDTNRYKDFVKSDIQNGLPNNELGMIRRTDPKNILNFLLQTYKNETWNNIHNTKLKKRNHKWVVEKIRKKPTIHSKREKMIKKKFIQETNERSFRTPIKTPQNEISPSFVMPFISKVQSMSKVPGTQQQQQQTYQVNTKWGNSKDTNYVNNNINNYGFVKETLPFELSGNIHFDKPRPSYFHHELHHFDYFD